MGDGQKYVGRAFLLLKIPPGYGKEHLQDHLEGVLDKDIEHIRQNPCKEDIFLVIFEEPVKDLKDCNQQLRGTDPPLNQLVLKSLHFESAVFLQGIDFDIVTEQLLTDCIQVIYADGKEVITSFEHNSELGVAVVRFLHAYSEVAERILADAHFNPLPYHRPNYNVTSEPYFEAFHAIIVNSLDIPRSLSNEVGQKKKDAQNIDVQEGDTESSFALTIINQREMTNLSSQREILENGVQGQSKPCHGSSGGRRGGQVVLYTDASGSSRVKMSQESNPGGSGNQSNKEESSSDSDSEYELVLDQKRTTDFGEKNAVVFAYDKFLSTQMHFDVIQQKEIVKNSGTVSNENIPAERKEETDLGNTLEKQSTKQKCVPVTKEIEISQLKEDLLSPHFNSEYVLAPDKKRTGDFSLGEKNGDFIAYETNQNAEAMQFEEIQQKEIVNDSEGFSSEYIPAEKKEKTKKGEQMTKEIQISHLKADLLSPHFSCNTCSVYFDSIKGKIIIQGTKEDVESKQVQLLTEITKIQEQPLNLSQECFEIFQLPQGKRYLDDQTLFCKWELRDKKLFVLSVQLEPVNRNIECFKAQLNAKETVDVSNMEREKVEFAILQCEKKFLVKIKIEDSKNELLICGVKDDVQRAKTHMSGIFQVDKKIQKTFQKKGLMASFYQKHLKDKVLVLRSSDVKIEQTFVSEEQIYKVTLTGKCLEVEKVFDQISELSANVDCMEWELQKENFEVDELWLISKSLQDLKRKFKSFESKYHCLINVNIPKPTVATKTSARKVKNPSLLDRAQDISFSSVARPDCKVYVKSYGDVTKEQSEVLVCVLTEQKDLRRTRVGQAFNSLCPNLWKELKDKADAKPSESVFVTSTTNDNMARQAIVHVVLQPWDPENSQKSETDFRKAIAKVLATADSSLQAKSISFPVMGCGRAFKFPPSVVAKAMLESVSDHLQSATGSLKNIVLLAPNAELSREFENSKETPGLSLIREVASKRVDGDKDDDENVKFKIVLPSPLPKSQNIIFRSVGRRNCNVHVKADGDVTKEKSDVLVCVLAEEKDLRMTRVGQSFNSQCPNLWKELKDKLKANPSDSVIVTSTANGNVACRAIIHVMLKPWDPIKSQNCETEFRKIIAQVLDTADNTLQAQSISFPVMGCGLAFQFPPSVVAKAMLETISVFFERGTGHLTNILLLAPDAELFTQFEKCKNTLGLSIMQEGASEGVEDDKNDENGDESKEDNDDENMFYKLKLQEHFSSSTVLIMATTDCSELWKKLKAIIRDYCLCTEYFNQEEIKRWPNNTKCHIESEAEKHCIIVEFSKHPRTHFPGVVIKGKKEDVTKMKMFIQLEFQKFTKYLPKARLNSHKAPKRGTKDFLKYAASCDEVFPSYWKLDKSNTSLCNGIKSKAGKDKKGTLEDVDKKTFQSIKDLVEKTWEVGKVGLGNDGKFPYKHQRLRVESIQRVENRQLFEKYSVSRKHLFERSSICPDIGKISGSKGPVKTTEILDDHLKSELYYEINEHYLFHGFKGNYKETIAQSGLDPKVGSFSGMFGRGTYFAESSTKADQYSDEKAKRTPLGTKLTMLLSRVLLGHVFLCNDTHPSITTKGAEKLKRPPCTSCLKDCCDCNEQLYDSVMGDGKWIFREFIVYDSAHCYPEYLITYVRE